MCVFQMRVVTLHLSEPSEIDLNHDGHNSSCGSPVLPRAPADASPGFTAPDTSSAGLGTSTFPPHTTKGAPTSISSSDNTLSVCPAEDAAGRRASSVQCLGSPPTTVRQCCTLLDRRKCPNCCGFSLKLCFGHARHMISPDMRRMQWTPVCTRSIMSKSCVVVPSSRTTNSNRNEPY